MTVTEDVL